MTHDHHVGFLFPQSGIGKHNKMSRNFWSSSYHNTKLQMRDKNINTHTWVKLKILLWSKSKITACFLQGNLNSLVFLYTTQYKKEIKDKIVRI